MIKSSIKIVQGAEVWFFILRKIFEEKIFRKMILPMRDLTSAEQNIFFALRSI
jgi:hypothetical protein